MGLWSSIITVTLFSIAVIVIDEIIHARRRKRREREGGRRASGTLLGSASDALLLLVLDGFDDEALDIVRPRLSAPSRTASCMGARKSARIASDSRSEKGPFSYMDADACHTLLTKLGAT